MAELKVALVTGASGEIGKAIAVALAKKGYNILLNYRSNETAALEVKSVIETEGVECVLLKGDVANYDEVETMMKKAFEAFGRIDVLVNNAGITRDSLIFRMSEADWDAVLDTNLKGTFNCCKHIARKMLKQKIGSIINISSVVGEMGNIGQANYSASKSGMIGLTKSLAKEFASRNVRVNVITPGFIETSMTEKIPEKDKNAMFDAIPLKCFGQPEDVANLVVFLASEQSKYITGQVIGVNGGLYI